MIALLLALLGAAPAVAQPICNRAVDPHYIGCLPAAGALTRSTTVPAAQGSAASGATVAQILGQMLPSDLPPVASSGSPTGRNLSARFADVRNLRDWVVPADGTDAALALARLCAAVTGDLRVALTGSWTWGSSVTGCGGRNLTVEGDGAGVTTVGASLAGVMLDVSASVGQRVTMRGMSIASSAGGGTSAVLRVTYPHVPSTARASVVIEDLDVASGGNTGVANSICRVVYLDGAWLPKLNRVTFNGPFSAPGAGGCAMVDLSESFSLSITHSQQLYGDALIYQSGYAEGVAVTDTSVIGTNYLMRQASSGITQRSGYNLLGVWMNQIETNTQSGGLQLTRTKGVMLGQMQWTQWTGVGTPGTFVAYDLTDTQSLTSAGDVFIGGPTPANFTAIKLRYGSLSADGNTWNGPVVENGAGVAVDFGVSTVQNAVLGMRGGATSAVTDNGANNIITRRTSGGAMMLSGSGAGGPTYGCEGAAASVGCTFMVKGSGGYSFVSDTKGTMANFAPSDGNAQANYPRLISGSSGNLAYFTGGGPRADLGLFPQSGGTLYLGASGATIPLCSAAPTGALCSASGSGSAVSVK